MTAVTGEPWKITGDERAKHDGQFYNLKPLNGFITGHYIAICNLYIYIYICLCLYE